MIPRDSIEALVAYLIETEEDDYAEGVFSGDIDPSAPNGHIYWHAVRVNAWLNEPTEGHTARQVSREALRDA